MIQKLDYIVVGAGISGLSAAWKLQQQGLQGVVLEAGESVGGCLDSVSDLPETVQELGAHSGFNSYAGLLEIWQGLDNPPALRAKQKAPFLLYQDGSLYKVMQKLGLARLLSSAWRIFFISKIDKTIEDYYGVVVGKKNYQEVIRHALASVVSQSADAMPADFLFQKRSKDKSVMRKFSFEGGMAAMVKAIAKTLKVQTQCTVQEISQSDVGWSVVTEQETLVAKKLILAVPATQAAAMIPALYDTLSAITSVTTDTLAVLLPSEVTAVEPCAGWIGVDAPFYSMISSDSVYPESEHRGFSFHFKPDIYTIEARKKMVCDMLEVTEKDISLWQEKQNVLPEVTEDHYQKIAAIEKILAEQEGLALTGNYFSGMAIEDCIQRSFSEVERLTMPKIE